MASVGRHHNLCSRQDTAPILTLWKTSSEKSSAQAQVKWQLMSKDFCHRALLALPCQGGPLEFAQGGLWLVAWLSQDSGLCELDPV